MRRIFGWIVAVVVAAVSVSAAYAGITILVEQGSKGYVYTGTVVSSENIATLTTLNMSGKIERAVTYPIGTAGTVPLAAYDCQILDRDGVDVMGGSLNDRINTASYQAYPWTIGSTILMKPVVHGNTTWTCQNMGTFKTFGVRIYVSE